jgi:hypothetical protein
MARADLRQILEENDDDSYIDGVYNYCNRWCERCPFAERCLNFTISSEMFPDEESQDIQSGTFWEGLHSVFAQTLELLWEMAAEQGVDLEAVNSPEERAAYSRRQAFLDAAVEESPLHQAAEEYVSLVDGWLDTSQELFQAKGEELNRLALAGLDESRLEEKAISLSDAVEVIRWYQLFISVKLMRAITSAIDEQDHDPELLAEFGRDSDGSAKIALIAIDHSIGAWGVLLAVFQDWETETLTILAHLDRLRRAAEREFPNARAFVRAGWDTGELDK